MSHLKTKRLATRTSLLSRLKAGADDAAWTEFHQIYQRLLSNFAIRLGVPENDVHDVVQETLISIHKAIPDFEYDRQRCSFKTWLLTIARHRVIDYFRHPDPQRGRPGAGAARSSEDTNRTTTIERIPDPQGADWERIWEQEWRSNLVELALERFKSEVSVKHFQVFYLHVIKQQSAGKVGRALGISAAQVYLVKHRLKGMFTRMVSRMERELDAVEAKSPFCTPAGHAGKLIMVTLLAAAG